MINPQHTNNYYPILKQKISVHLKPLNSLNSITIYSIPTRIKDRDIIAMFNGVSQLLREKIKQEYNEKYLNLKLKYDRLKYLYDKLKRSVNI